MLTLSRLIQPLLPAPEPSLPWAIAALLFFWVISPLLLAAMVLLMGAHRAEFWRDVIAWGRSLLAPVSDPPAELPIAPAEESPVPRAARVIGQPAAKGFKAAPTRVVDISTRRHA